MSKTFYAIVLVGIKSKREVTISLIESEEIAIHIAKSIQELQKEKTMAIAIGDISNGLHQLEFVGGDSGNSVVFAIVKDPKAGDFISNAVQSLQVEGGFTISILELEKKENNNEPETY